jgi:hypothetical protein
MKCTSILSLVFTALILVSIQPEALMAEQGIVPHPKGCADDEIYISSQDWWLTTPGEVGDDGLPGEDFGHLHTELCFPHKATISGEMTLDITSIMHHNPGEFYKLIVQIWAEGLPDLSGVCGEGSAVACAEFDPPRTLASCEASGGTLIGAATCQWQDSLSFDSSIFPFDGWQQFRVRGKVHQTDGSDMRTSTGLHAYLSNGYPISHVYENPDRIEGRGWYTNADWEADQYHAFLDTSDLTKLWSDPGAVAGLPARRHLVGIEVFNAAGHRLRPNGTPATGLSGAEIEAAFTYRRKLQDIGPTNMVPFGALSHLFWWDNRDIVALIDDLRMNGIESDEECQFMTGTPSSTFGIGYRAYHPWELFQRRHVISWKRGLGGGSDTMLNSPLNVGVPPAPVGASPTHTFGHMLNHPVPATPLHTKCAFTVFLNITNKRTDGDGLGFSHSQDSAAFALEVGP